MSERNRLELLKRAGLMAWEGLKTVVKGVDVVIDPNEPPQQQAKPTGSEKESGESDSPLPPPPDGVGTVIGRRAMAAAEHRVGSAQTAQRGLAVNTQELLSQVPLTLALYPGPASLLVAQALGLEPAELPAEGDLEVEAMAHDLAWLPLEMGHQFYGRMGESRLAAVGGYRRAALVRFTTATPRYEGTWAALGDDALAAILTPDQQGKLLLEAPEKLWGVMERGGASAALLGGELLERALALPGAVVEAEYAPSDELVPVWGLFTAGRAVALTPIETSHLQILPVVAKVEEEEANA